MSGYELAQLNVAQMRAPLASPGMAGFTGNLERINALADAAPGFVWRLQTEDGDATALRPFGDDVLVNVSVWRDVASLHAYVYGSAHVEIMRRRQEWFDKMKEAHLVLWWVPAGHRPDEVEAKARLEMVRSRGPTPEAFTLRDSFPPPDTASVPAAAR